MKKKKHIYGPVPSRRLGRSLGVSPIPVKTCNYACNYCMLGATSPLINEPKEWFPLEEILSELKEVLARSVAYDTITICGEGEPTLYAPLKELIDALRQLQNKPIAVIINGATMDRPEVRQALLQADLVLPSLEAADEATWRTIHHPHPSLSFSALQKGLEAFCADFDGLLWLEVMLLGGINDGDAEIEALRKLIKKLNPDRVYINTPVRPPADPRVRMPQTDRIAYAVEQLGGIALDFLADPRFTSVEEDPLAAVLTICKRHPMNQYEITHFAKELGVKDLPDFFRRLEAQEAVEKITYQGISSYRNHQED